MGISQQPSLSGAQQLGRNAPNFCSQAAYKSVSRFFHSLGQSNPIRAPENIAALREPEGIPEPKFHGEVKAAMSVALALSWCNLWLVIGFWDSQWIVALPIVF